MGRHACVLGDRISDGSMTINTAWQDLIITIYADENIPVQYILDALWAE